MRIKAKILIPMIVLTLFTATAILATNIFLFTGFVDDSSISTVTVAAATVTNRIESMKAHAGASSLYMAADDALASALAANDREALLARATELQNELGMEFCTITDAQGTVVLRTHEPDNYGDSVASQVNVKAAMGGKSLTAVEQGSAVLLSIRSGSPVFDAQGRVAAVMSVGFRLDTDSFVDAAKALTGLETTVFLGDVRISTTVVKEDGTRAVGTTAAPNVSETVLGGGTYVGEAGILGRNAYTSYVPIAGPNGEVLGMLFCGQYLDVAAATTRSFILAGVMVVLVSLAVSIAAILFITGRIVSPIRAMVKAASDLALGATDIEIRVDTKDETRALADAFNDMIDNTRQQVQTIEHMAAGDYAVSLAARSERDAMNNALISMLDLNNRVFADIAGSSEQVATGSQQIAQAAQAMAQGATEQAASVEELSASIADIRGMARENTQTAEEALHEVRQASELMGACVQQMHQMLDAMGAIDAKSQDISKTTKVIDDIAFQTNILALNAAVEAARAGEHGKGFAVVADEVRNLASKSAEAARETAALIESSSQSVADGNRIVERVNESLQAVAEIAAKSADKMDVVKTVSVQQSAAMEQVNMGIDQVAQVVQQNSATAQQSAAASEEMDGQSIMLRELLSRFRLRESKAALRVAGLPPINV